MAQAAVVGIDVGGTRIKAALLSPEAQVLAETTRPTPADIGDRIGLVAEQIVRELTESLDDLTESLDDSGQGVPLRLGGVGLAVPGWVDEDSGQGRWSANLGWRDLDLRAALAEHIDLPIAVGQDVRAGLSAEHRFGAARGVDNVLFVPLGTGLASALLIRGRPVAGTHWAGEIGHVVVEPGGDLCGCGRRGCLETVASAGSIGRRWRVRSGERGDSAEVARLTAAGDAVAAAVWQEAVSALAGALAPVVAATGTELVLLGGGLVRSGELLLAPLRAELAERLGVCDGVSVAAAALGDRAGSLGAATLALDLLAADADDAADPADPRTR